MRACGKAREERVDAGDELAVEGGDVAPRAHVAAHLVARVVERHDRKPRSLLGPRPAACGSHLVEEARRLGERPRAAQAPGPHEPARRRRVGEAAAVLGRKRGPERIGGKARTPAHVLRSERRAVALRGLDRLLRLVVEPHRADIERDEARALRSEDAVAVALDERAHRAEVARRRELRQRLAHQDLRVGVALPVLDRPRRRDPRPVRDVLAAGKPLERRARRLERSRVERGDHRPAPERCADRRARVPRVEERKPARRLRVPGCARLHEGESEDRACERLVAPQVLRNLAGRERAVATTQHGDEQLLGGREIALVADERAPVEQAPRREVARLPGERALAVDLLRQEVAADAIDPVETAVEVRCALVGALGDRKQQRRLGRQARGRLLDVGEDPRPHRLGDAGGRPVPRPRGGDAQLVAAAARKRGGERVGPREDRLLSGALGRCVEHAGEEVGQPVEVLRAVVRVRRPREILEPLRRQRIEPARLEILEQVVRPRGRRRGHPRRQRRGERGDAGEDADGFISRAHRSRPRSPRRGRTGSLLRQSRRRLRRTRARRAPSPSATPRARPAGRRAR